MPRTPIADTAGACWLAAQAGRPVSPRIAALRIDVADTGARRRRRQPTPCDDRRFEYVKPISLEEVLIDPVARSDRQIDHSFIDALRVACGEKLASFLEAGMSLREAASALGVNHGTLSRRLARVRKEFAHQFSELCRNGRNE